MEAEVREDGLELVRGAPHARLRGFVHGYDGYVETAANISRRETPATFVPMIISWGEPLEIVYPSRSGDRETRHDFISGLIDTYVVTESAPSTGFQVNFTPIGARMFLGLPLNEIANRTVTLEDVFGAEGPRLVERLQNTPDWAQRFAVLDAAILRRVDAAPAPSEEIVLAWHRLSRSGGNVSIGALAEEAGWSRKHLIARFRDQIGLPPKTMARVIRFNAAVRRLRAQGNADWTGIVADCGYYDQAHLLREFREFAGMTPREFLRTQLPQLAAWNNRT
jgi:AraC-like DNA-binding protein